MRGIYIYFPIFATTCIGLPTALYAQVTPVDQATIHPNTVSQATHIADQTTRVEPTAPLSLATAIKQAENYAPIKKILATRQDIREAELQQSHLRINPELSISSLGLKNNQQEQSIAINQRIDLFGVRSAKTQLAQARLDSESIQQSRYQSQLRLMVMVAYRQVALTEQRLNLAYREQQLSQQSVAVAKRRFEAGRIAEVELTRMQISQLQADSYVQNAQNALTIARQDLSRFWGNPTPTFTQTISDSTWPALNRAELIQRLENNPNLKLANQAIVESDAQLKLTQSQAYAMPTVSVGMRRITDSNQPAYTQATIGLSMPIPLFSRNQGALLAAQSGQQLAQQQLHMTRLQREQRLNRLMSQADHLSQRYESIIKQQLPQTRLVQQKILQGFSEGKFSVLEVQQAQRDLLQLEQTAQTTLDSGWQTTLHIEALLSGVALDADLTSSVLLDTLNSSLINEGMADAANLSGATP